MDGDHGFTDGNVQGCGCPPWATECPRPVGPIPPGTPTPKVSVEVWDGEDEVGAAVADVVRIDDTWHVVVTLDG